MSRPFLKMNGLGNDFVVVEARSAPFAPTPEEVAQLAGLGVEVPTLAEMEEIEVSTVVNGEQRRTNVVANMTHRPASLVSFHSAMMPLYPGDIISTGTPGAIVVAEGDVVEADIPGVGHLRTTVRAEAR